MYYRFISNNNFPTTESGGSWNTIAWTSDILPINAYNYANGCLVKLNISSDSNSMISVHVTGNAYSTATSTKVINSIAEFYNYKDGNDILNYNATHFGYNFGDIKIFNYDNKVCLWFKQDHNYMSFSVFANYTNSSSADNKVLSISNLAMPTSGVTRSKTITPKTIAYQSDIPTSLPANGGNSDTVDNVHLEWSGSQSASSTEWLAGWTADGTKIKAVKRADLSVNYASSAGNADTLDDIDSTDFLRKVSVSNSSENDFNSFSNMTLTGRGDPTTGASLKNAPWTGAGPAGGYGVLTYLWSGYGT